MSLKITKVLINIPIPIEKPINPSLYSFFQGLKKVFIKSERENNFKKALLSDPKKAIISFGAS